MALILSIVLSFVPAFFYALTIYWLDRYEKEPTLLLGGVFLWGAVVAVIGAVIWSLIFQGGIFFFTGSEQIAEVAGITTIAPLVEESFKGLAVLLVFLIFRREFDSVLDGIVYASITALGFAATENVLYLYFGGYQEEGMGGLLTLFVLRVVLGGWNHAMFTSFTGIGFALARTSRQTAMKLFAPLGGLILAMLAHGVHNSIALLVAGAFGLVGLLIMLAFDWLGGLLIFGVVVWSASRERRWIVDHLREEVDLSTITPEQYRIACSGWAQSGARLRALFRGCYRPTARFYQLCGELAHKKQQRLMLGEETGNSKLIEQLRGELLRLSPQALHER